MSSCTGMVLNQFLWCTDVGVGAWWAWEFSLKLCTTCVWIECTISLKTTTSTFQRRGLKTGPPGDNILLHYLSYTIFYFCLFENEFFVISSHYLYLWSVLLWLFIDMHIATIVCNLDNNMKVFFNVVQFVGLFLTTFYGLYFSQYYQRVIIYRQSSIYILMHKNINSVILSWC